MADEDKRITVKIGVFSGRENPEFMLDDAAQAQFAEMMQAVVGVEPANPPGHPKLGQFYGFLVTVPADLVTLLDLPEATEVRGGVVSPAAPKTDNGHWRDTAGLEAFLVGQAVEAGHGEILREYGVESPKDK